MKVPSASPLITWLCTALIALSLSACLDSGNDSNDINNINDSPHTTNQAIPAAKEEYVVFAWNDLGMHCLNPSYDTAVILPPYNTVWAQVLKRGNPPQIVTSGLSVEYRILHNTTSANKGNFGQFWENALQLFGETLVRDDGLDLDNPAISNGLSGTMVAKADHFQVNGIPVTPINDNGKWNPYQVAEITVKNANGNVIAQTRTTVPTSDEIRCDKCHLPTIANNQNAFLDILQKHDKLHQPPDGLLVPKQPLLCASCHGSPALGLTTPGDSGKYLSAAIHRAHATRGAPDGTPISCYDCHPGTITKCNRSLAHSSVTGNCSTCHGGMLQVADSINSGNRVPWADEPRCVTCHAEIAEVNTGTALYRNSAGHGGIYCAGCHGSPHTMFPSRQSTDNYQPIQYQSVAKSIGSCGVCHSKSRGKGTVKFSAAHGNGKKVSSCEVCHTAYSALDNTTKWPHLFQWKER